VANIKSQIKRNRQNEAARVRNKSVRTALKTATKQVRSAVEASDAQAAQDAFRSISRDLDRAASSGILHKRAAARRKSRLARATARTAATAGE
jgi:small subunit ribosomal protein S20